jgi:hypothetical protein
MAASPKIKAFFLIIFLFLLCVDCCFYRLNGEGMKSLHLFCAKSVKQKKLASQVQDFAFSALYLKKGT